MKKLFTLLTIALSLTIGIKATQTTFKMDSLAYQTIVDSVNKKELNGHKFPKNSEDYYGASAYYDNFDIEYDGSWDKEAFSSWQEAVQAGISKEFLPGKYPDATTDDTVTVEFKTYNGSSGETGSFTFYCSKAAPNPEFKLIEIPTVFKDDFEGGDLSKWNAFSVTGDQVWALSSKQKNSDTASAYMNGYDSGNKENVDWLITKNKIDVSTLTKASLVFYSYYDYNGDSIKVKYSADYDGTGDPTAKSFTWTELDPTLPSSNKTWTFSGNLDLSSIPEKEYYIAFVYTSTTKDGRAWYIDDVAVQEYTPSSKAAIENFEIEGQIGKTEIDDVNDSIFIVVAPKTDLTKLKATMAISAGATIVPESAEDFSAPVKFTVTAEDGSKREWVVKVEELADVATSIKDIQYVEGADLDGDNGNSPLLDDIVIVNGIVTAFGSFSSWNIYYIQNITGPWNGIYVYDRVTGEVLAQGDSVKVIGKIAEYYNLTEIEASSVEKLESRKTMPQAHTLTGALDESLEGVLVKLENVQVSEDTDEKDSKKAFKTKVGGKEVKIYNDLYADLTFDAGKSYNVTGVVIYSHGNYRVSPRAALDVESISSINNNTVTEYTLNVYPNPCSNGTLNIEGSNGQATIINVLGKVVKTIYPEQDKVNVSELPNGIYFVKTKDSIVRFIKK